MRQKEKGDVTNFGFFNNPNELKNELKEVNNNMTLLK